jgi:hypothetical protein
MVLTDTPLKMLVTPSLRIIVVSVLIKLGDSPPPCLMYSCWRTFTYGG